MDYGIKVTATGYNINTSDITKIIMSSKYPMLKYHLDVTGSVTVDEGVQSGELRVHHDLFYIPMGIAYVTYSGDSYQRMIPEGRVPQPWAISLFLTNTEAVCKITQDGMFTTTYQFRIIVFKDKIV